MWRVTKAVQIDSDGDGQNREKGLNPNKTEIFSVF